MKRYSRLYTEFVDLPNDKWIDVNIHDLSDEQLHALWTVYEHSYKDIGLSVPSLKDLTQKYKLSWVIDIDRNDLPDAFIIYKVTPHGNKLALTGASSNSMAKRSMIDKMISFAKTKGNYLETSHKVKEIMEKNHVPRVDDKATVEKLLDSHDIEWIGNGEYKRHIKGLGNIQKTMFGIPH